MAPFDGHQAEEGDSQNQEDSECPVCYDSLSGMERTLSCGHVFCHDCLVKTLVSINRDGVIRDTIICPVCRHLTFIKKQQEVGVPLAPGKEAEEVGGQTLKVPVPVPPPAPSNPPHPHGARRASRQSSSPSDSSGLNWIVRRFRWISVRCRSRRTLSLISPDHRNSQIFIISAQGRPMADEDAVSMDTMPVVPQPNRRRRRIRICTTARCLVILLVIFTLMAMVAATLPWILLA
ncbi:RING finger protein 222 [Coregonus clupeaformis]|uniref:RING finger protein 222 n=1 Tax=Coregonus clupeaformis TaxID=59861 RepID=UPI001BDFE26D|nr:RING finger protein 222 [Coregonus clupeaformis]